MLPSPETVASHTSNFDHLRDWIGRTEQHSDSLGANALARLSATLNRADESQISIGSALPPLAHWLYFLPRAVQSDIGADGHPKRGGFLPPVPLPRRMWAGGRLQFHRDLKLGDAVQRQSTISQVDVKSGRSGTLVFVTVRHEISDDQGVAITEEQDIVYRGQPLPGAPVARPADAPVDETFRREIMPDPVLLFRYSALTFNAHRIHYDRPYATQVEGYPGLVVHGPLIAMLLLDLLRCERPQSRVRAFSFKAASPLFDTQPFTLCSKDSATHAGVQLWARNPQGQLAMQAHADLA
jgi:3-methylfumaryl-CoA hydratase